MIREENECAPDSPMLAAWRAFGNTKEYPKLLEWANGGIFGNGPIAHKALFAAFAEGWCQRISEPTTEPT